MVKSELIQKLSAETDIPPKIAEIAVNTVFNGMTEALIRGDGIEIRGFGSYRVKKKNSRQARNPKTGQQVFVPEHYVPTFKFSREFKEMVNIGMMQKEREAAS